MKTSKPVVSGAPAVAKPRPRPKPEPELPQVTTFGMTPVPKGWSVVKIVTEGRTVIEEEVLGDPPVMPKSHADNLLKFEIIKHFILNTEKAS